MQVNESVETLLDNKNLASDNQQAPLRAYVEHALQGYFSELGEQSVTDLYQLVIAEVELPLLKAVLSRTNGNQSKAAQMLGINRGTLRKKLKEYNLEEVAT